MEARRITVVDTRVNRTKSFESTAETMAEMLADFRANGIDATDMAIQEGLTKTEMNENSILPKDVSYKGTVTNNLVFRLTQKEKKTRSGMDRKEVYAMIKNNHLENMVKEALGRNYTQVPTVDLIKLIESTDTCDCNEDCCNVITAIITLASILQEYDFISKEDLNQIASILDVEIEDDEEEVYTPSELNEMFEGMD